MPRVAALLLAWCAVAPGAARALPPVDEQLAAIQGQIEQGNTGEALRLADGLTAQYPGFALAHLLRADVLRMQPSSADAASAWDGPQDAESALREELHRRLQAVREPPPAGSVPAEFLRLPRSVRHAIAVDTSRSRLYLFANDPEGLRLLGHYYAAIGRQGAGKRIEGDGRTPLGVYFITSRLTPEQLAGFYGSGALPLNYPNEYDRAHERTGSGIWLHGMPADEFSRPPYSTDGCIVLSNPDLETLLSSVTPGATPVVVAERLRWLPAAQVRDRAFMRALAGWRGARAHRDVDRVMRFYSPRFRGGPQREPRAAWRASVEQELAARKGKAPRLKELSILAWPDRAPLRVVTFGEVWSEEWRGPVKRQYWRLEGGQWRIFYEGVIG